MEELQNQFKTEENEKNVPLLRPAFSETCFVTKFIRKSSYGILNQTNYSCEKFLQSVEAKLKVNLNTYLLSQGFNTVHTMVELRTSGFIFYTDFWKFYLR